MRQITMEIAALSSGIVAEPQTVKEFYEDWLESQRMEGKPPGTLSKYTGIVKAFLAYIGDRAAAPFDSMDSSDFEGFRLASFDSGKSASTVSNYIKILRFAYTRAKNLNRITTNPTIGVGKKHSKDKKHSKAAFTFEQVQLLLQTVSVSDYPEEWKTLILVSYLAGFAQSDAASLRWEQIDFQKRSIYSIRIKTREEVATLMPPELYEHLLSLSAPDNPKAYLMPRLAAQKAQQRSRTFARVMQAAGIDERRSERKEGGRSVASLTLHCLRHSFATTLQASGLDHETIAKGMGHTNTKQTRAYTHAEQELLEKAFAKMPSLLK